MGRVAVFLLEILVAGGVVACGADDDTSETLSGVTSAVEAFTDAVNTYDTEALLAVTTEDFRWYETRADE